MTVTSRGPHAINIDCVYCYRRVRRRHYRRRVRYRRQAGAGGGAVSATAAARARRRSERGCYDVRRRWRGGGQQPERRELSWPALPPTARPPPTAVALRRGPLLYACAHAKVVAVRIGRIATSVRADEQAWQSDGQITADQAIVRVPPRSCLSWTDLRICAW